MKQKNKRLAAAMVEHEPDPAPEPVAERPTRQTMTAADRRNWLRKQAGWPALKEK